MDTGLALPYGFPVTHQPYFKALSDTHNIDPSRTA